MGRSRRRRINKWNQDDQWVQRENTWSERNTNESQWFQSGIIPYEIETDKDYKYNRIKRAISTIEKYSRFQFVECFFEGSDHECLLITEEDGCYFAEDGIGQGHISLGVGCESFGTILHELLHALGFPHEQRRPDRDNYITINWENIQRGFKAQFRKLKPHEYNWLWSQFPFDYDSIMMYEEYVYSKNGSKTIEALDGTPIRRKNRLSDLDKYKLSLL